MKKTTYFQGLIKTNRKALKGQGFKNSTLSMWIHGNRIPDWDNAVRLSMLLDVPVTSLPYHKIERSL